MKQQAQRVYENMALLALDLLACIVAGRIDRGPPFSALLTLWLSMMPAVGKRLEVRNRRRDSAKAI
jgi:hypothetical protein